MNADDTTWPRESRKPPDSSVGSVSAYRLGSLFSGIGGFELGFEWTGAFETVFQVEQNPFCQKVLAKHWPQVSRFDDVRNVGSHNLPACDILVGGFPCQNVSLAGKGEGVDGPQSGLWREFNRIIGELRPRVVVVENVPALAFRGLERVLGDLTAHGFNAEWQIVSAAALNAPHSRERMFIVAYPHGQRRAEFDPATVPTRAGQFGGRDHAPIRHTPSAGLPDWAGGEMGQPSPVTQFERPSGREIERNFRGISSGVSRRVDRLRALGNAVVPQVAYFVAQRILMSGLLNGSNAA